MQLPEFILDNMERILAEWESFARSIWPGAATDPKTLRDHAEAVHRAAVADVRSAQTETQRSDKSKGNGARGPLSARMNAASVQHGEDRSAHRFELDALVSEYRALRASVLRLWRESTPVADASDLDDLTRFSEAVDQSLAAAVQGYSEAARRTTAALAAEQAARMGAETASRAKDEFLRTLSHELRTPLNATVLWLHVLKKRPPSPAELREGLAAIERSTRAQLRLVQDLLDVSAAVSGRLELTLRPTPLNGPVSAAVAALRPLAEERGVTLGVDLCPTPLRASCDAARIEQLVWNLLDNAIKFTPRGGAVVVTLAAAGPAARIAVTDTGRGIDVAFLPHLFDHFRQADASTTRTAGGLGLGLSIVKHLVRLHGGTIAASSPGPDAGSTFTVELPLA